MSFLSSLFSSSSTTLPFKVLAPLPSPPSSLGQTQQQQHQQQQQQHPRWTPHAGVHTATKSPITIFKYTKNKSDPFGNEYIRRGFRASRRLVHPGVLRAMEAVDTGAAGGASEGQNAASMGGGSAVRRG